MTRDFPILISALVAAALMAMVWRSLPRRRVIDDAYANARLRFEHGHLTIEEVSPVLAILRGAFALFFLWLGTFVIYVVCGGSLSLAGSLPTPLRWALTTVCVTALGLAPVWLVIEAILLRRRFVLTPDGRLESHLLLLGSPIRSRSYLISEFDRVRIRHLNRIRRGTRWRYVLACVSPSTVVELVEFPEEDRARSAAERLSRMTGLPVQLDY